MDLQRGKGSVSYDFAMIVTSQNAYITLNGPYSYITAQQLLFIFLDPIYTGGGKKFPSLI